MLSKEGGATIPGKRAVLSCILQGRTSKTNAEAPCTAGRRRPTTWWNTHCSCRRMLANESRLPHQPLQDRRSLLRVIGFHAHRVHIDSGFRLGVEAVKTGFD